ncbi:M14 family zinc carboxypeptidase [Nesterenkonia lutea]|uniref:Peptidase M14 domain-containing protein n=1 Tax=Nesterenkonia lutea TaxID=272919 RepID=A0ABR9JFV1_9MICC|nr:M14 family zinc carboxypeptidase [Nesterenkonia lutea]MBE1524812.1 hypothetical protein [Nesterenkonia lutea]
MAASNLSGLKQMHTSGLSAALAPLQREEILRRARGLPEVHHYPTVDQLNRAFAELEAEHPELMSVQQIGHSRAGDPILLYSIRGGPTAALNGLLAGGVHPNEPIGSWTMLYLARELLSDPELRSRLGASWHFLPCADPDAMRLNEGWFHDPQDRTRYFEHFYRPAGREQVEWTFPFTYKSAHFDAMLPETRALQRAIDRVRPDLYMPLHNAEAGGAYYYLSEPMEPLHELLGELPPSLGVPLHRGEPEAAHFEVLAPGVFAMGTLEEAYDWTEALGLDPFPEGSTGESSTGYARTFGTVSMVAEMPLWKHPGADDVSLTQHSYARLLEEQAQQLSSSGALLMDLLERFDAQGEKSAGSAPTEPPLLRASRAFLPLLGQAAGSQRARAAAAESQRAATVAEAHGLRGILHMLRLRFGGMFLRALRQAATADADDSAGAQRTVAGRLAAELAPEHADWLAQALAEETELEAIPIKDVAGLQYGAVLALTAHVLRERQQVSGSA